MMLHLIMLASMGGLANPCPEGVRDVSDLVHPWPDTDIGAKIQFYVERLGDTSYVAFRPLEDLCVEWYEAPEQLAIIGAPALPDLIRVLAESESPYEVTQVLYALKLAGQDHRIRLGLGIETPRQLAAYPEPDEHAALRHAWMEWWHSYGAGIEATDLAMPQFGSEE
ncbi:MAG: hypothetical protein R3B81_16115 [bacterium]